MTLGDLAITLSLNGAVIVWSIWQVVKAIDHLSVEVKEVHKSIDRLNRR